MDIAHLLFSFQGRIRRRDFWIVFLIFSIVTSISLPRLFGLPGAHPDFSGEGLIGLAIFVLSVWIHLAVLVKRWHDRDKSGWWVLIALIPVIGWIWQLVEAGFLEGTPGVNRYGLPPKTVAKAGV